MQGGRDTWALIDDLPSAALRVAVQPQFTGWLAVQARVFKQDVDQPTHHHRRHPNQHPRRYLNLPLRHMTVLIPVIKACHGFPAQPTEVHLLHGLDQFAAHHCRKLLVVWLAKYIKETIVELYVVEVLFAFVRWVQAPGAPRST